MVNDWAVAGETSTRELRSRYLHCSDAELLRECAVDTFRGSGPGGQKRNKTDSAVRLRHHPTGLSAQASESRSQHVNRVRALWRLRERFAFDLRAPVHEQGAPSPAVASLLGRGAPRPPRHSIEYLEAVGELLDRFVAAGCSVRDAAVLVGTSTGALSRLLVGDDALRREVNQLRGARGMKPLR